MKLFVSIEDDWIVVSNEPVFLPKQSDNDPDEFNPNFVGVKFTRIPKDIHPGEAEPLRNKIMEELKEQFDCDVERGEI